MLADDRRFPVSRRPILNSVNGVVNRVTFKRPRCSVSGILHCLSVLIRSGLEIRPQPGVAKVEAQRRGVDDLGRYA
jgi:hypothetical protein